MVRVERMLQLGVDWSVETRVQRLSPAGSALAVSREDFAEWLMEMGATSEGFAVGDLDDSSVRTAFNE